MELLTKFYRAIKNCFYILNSYIKKERKKERKKECLFGTPTKRQVSKRQVSKRLGFQNVRFQNVRFTKRQVNKTSAFKTSGIKTSPADFHQPQVQNIYG
jgi:hypothetical protein